MINCPRETPNLEEADRKKITRRRLRIACAHAASSAVVDSGLVLGGVMIKNDVRKAYVFSRAKAGGAWIGEGDDFMGWQIRSINKTNAQLEQKGRSIDLQLYPQE